MGNPDVAEYWKRIEEGWSDSVAAANEGSVEESFAARRLRNPFRRARGPIFITGMSGTGKSVMYKMLQGLIGERYKKTHESEDVERGRVGIAKDGSRIRAKIYVLPGQRDSQPRLDAVDRFFKYGNYPVGVVHVVDWGLAEVWDSGARQELLRKLAIRSKPRSLTEVGEYLRTTQELDDFKRTSRLLKDAWADRTDEIWFIVAVAKCDLYWPQITDVGKYYIPDNNPKADSFFGKEVRALIEQLQFPKFAVLPISCVSDPFDFSTEIRTAASDFDNNWRAALISRMLKTIGGFNGL